MPKIGSRSPSVKQNKLCKYHKESQVGISIANRDEEDYYYKLKYAIMHLNYTWIIYLILKINLFKLL